MPQKTNPRTHKRRKLLVLGRCEGQQEEMYFKHLQRLINEQSTRKRDAQLRITSAGGFNPLHVVKEAARMAITVDRADRPYHVAVFDHDFKAEFEDALDLCKEEKIKPAYTSVCFDLWMLLHKRDFRTIVANTGGYVDAVCLAYGLPNGTNIKNEDIIKNMLEQINLAAVRDTINRAKGICRNNRDTERPSHVTRRNLRYYDNPDLSLHLLVEDILNLAGV